MPRRSLFKSVAACRFTKTKTASVSWMWPGEGLEDWHGCLLCFRGRQQFVFNAWNVLESLKALFHEGFNFLFWGQLSDSNFHRRREDGDARLTLLRKLSCDLSVILWVCSGSWVAWWMWFDREDGDARLSLHRKWSVFFRIWSLLAFIPVSNLSWCWGID